jgi:hypothetical protein
MKFILKLKHWQLFLITWGTPILIDVCTFSNPALLIRLFPVMMLVFMASVFGWIWSISTVLHKKLPVNVNLNVGLLKILLLVPILYMLLLFIGMDIQLFKGSAGSGESVGLTIFPLIIILHLVSMACILLSVRFAAKTLKSIELGRLAKFGDYVGEFFLLWFSPVGIWILQPRLNKLIE